MGFFTFGNPERGNQFRVPSMDTDTALRYILQILNESSILGGGGSAGTGGSGSTGASFTTGSDVIVTAAGVAKQAVGVPSPRGVLVVAKVTNTGSVYIGGSNVTNASGSRRGIELVQAGMPSVILPVSSTDLIYVNADNANDGVGLVIL